MNRELGVRATINEAKDGVINDLIHEADAAAAHDAAFVIEANAGADLHVLRLLDLHLFEARGSAAVID